MSREIPIDAKKDYDKVLWYLREISQIKSELSIETDPKKVKKFKKELENFQSLATFFYSETQKYVLFPVIECYSDLDEESLAVLQSASTEIPLITFHVRNTGINDRKIRSQRKHAGDILKDILNLEQEKKQNPATFGEAQEKKLTTYYRYFGLRVGEIADLGVDLSDEFSEESEYVQNLIRKLFSEQYHGFTKSTRDLHYSYEKIRESIEISRKAEEEANLSDNPDEEIVKARAVLGGWVRHYLGDYLQSKVDENTEIKDEYFPGFSPEEIAYFRLCFSAYWQKFSIAAQKVNAKVHAFGTALGDTGRDIQENILRKAAKEAAAVPAARRTQLQNDALNAVEILDQLDFMHEKGVLSDDEYRAKRKEYMGV